jgi:hypothetical protein
MIKSFLLFTTLLLVLFRVDSAMAAGCDGLKFKYVTSAQIIMDTQNDQPQPLELIKTANGSCSYFIVAGPGLSSTWTLKAGNDTIPIYFYKSSGHAAADQVKSLSEASPPSGAITLPAFSGNSKEVTAYFYPYINKSVTIPSGTYSGNFDFYLYKVENSVTTLVDTKSNVTHKYFNQETVALSLVNASTTVFDASATAYTIDFGSLTSGESSALNLILQYTSGYNLYMSSANGGKLKHETLTDTINYTLKLDSVAVSLTGSSPVKTDSGVSPATGKVLPLEVVVGSVAGRAGRYNDLVTISISAL